MSKHAPMSAVETRVYLPGMAGGFDVRNCPQPEELAALIVKAVNNHDALVAALRKIADGADKSSELDDAEGWAMELCDIVRAARVAIDAVEAK